MTTTAIGSMDAFVHKDPLADGMFRFVPQEATGQAVGAGTARSPLSPWSDATTDPSGPPCTNNCITRQFSEHGATFDVTVTSADHPMAFTRCHRAPGLRDDE